MRSRAWPWFPLGLLAGGIGLLPWLVHGGALPLQNLASDPTVLPFVLLPFSQYAVSTLAALLVLGGAIGGAVARVRAGDLRAAQRVLLVFGVVLVQAGAITQTALVVRGGLQQRPEAATYLLLLVGGSIVAALLGVIVLLLIAARSHAPVVVGAALAAVLLPSWVGALLVAPVEQYSGPSWPLAVLPWLPPILVGATIAWSGVGTVGRAVAAVFAGVTLWVGPALVTAITSAVGSRVYARDPVAMLQAGLRVLTSALGGLETVVPVLLVAASIAAVGIATRRAALRSAPGPRRRSFPAS